MMGRKATGEEPQRPLPRLTTPALPDDYGLRSMHDVKFGLLSSSIGTGKFTSVP